MTTGTGSGGLVKVTGDSTAAGREGSAATPDTSSAADAADAPAATGTPLLSVEHLQMHFPVRSGVLVGREVARVRAVDDVTFTVAAGETLGIVGESGCGKTTLARCIVRLLTPTGGTVSFAGRDITTARERALRPVRRDLQMVFQNPYASLNPRRRVGAIVGAALPRGRSRQERSAEVGRLLEQVGLDAGAADRYPASFSGGQRQRIGIARALAVRPRLLVLDEPVSALDVSVQAQVVNLVDQLQDDLGLAYIFVAHDLSVVRHVADRVAVMYLGKIVELAEADALYARPVHWYTKALLDAVPVPSTGRTPLRDRTILAGDPASAIDVPPGCAFSPRCPAATELCRTVEPPLAAYPDGHLAACHHPRSVGPAEMAAATVSPASPRSASDRLPTAAA